MQFGTQSSVDAEELLVHDRRQRQRTKRFDAGFVDGLAIFVLTFQLESEIIRQMSAFVIASKQPERVRIPDLQCPEVEDTLDMLESPGRLGTR